MSTSRAIKSEHRRIVRPGGRGLLGPLVLSCGLAVLLGAALIAYCGVWNFLANTRLLDLFIRGGIIAYHDDQIGFVHGVNDYADYLKSQDPISWPVLAVVVAIFWLFWIVKGVQFHLLCRFYGIEGSLIEHARAYNRSFLYNSYLPYRIGDIAGVETLTARDAPAENAAAVFHVMDLFVIFEIVVFALIALPGEGWGPWLMQLFWSVVILGAALFIWRPSMSGGATPTSGLRSTARIAWSELSREPRTLLALCLLSLLAFGVEDIAAYLTAMSFTGDHVKLHVEFSVLLMGVCGSYIARLVPVTPGGIGQFELGFAAALYVGGVGIPEAVTIAVLDNFVRYVAFLPYYGVTTLWASGIDARAVFATFTRADPATADG